MCGLMPSNETCSAQGDVLKLNFSAKDLKIKDRIWRGKVCFNFCVQTTTM
jgi:hypothetical protein